MFANCQLSGVDLALPDVCLTPLPWPVPLPYPNIALGATAIPTAHNILFMGMPAHNLTGSFSVLLKGSPATRLTSVSLQNTTNMSGMRAVPSQFKVVMLAPWALCQHSHTKQALTLL